MIDTTAHELPALEDRVATVEDLQGYANELEDALAKLTNHLYDLKQDLKHDAKLLSALDDRECRDCLEKDRRIDEADADNDNLRAKVDAYEEALGHIEQAAKAVRQQFSIF